MKKALLCILLTISVLILTCCGGAASSSGGGEAKTEEPQGPDLSANSVYEIRHPEDKDIEADFSVDQDYTTIKVLVHADVNNDSFEGTAECTTTVAPANSGILHTASVSGNDEWTYSGTFKNVGIGNGTLDISAPDLTGAKITVTIFDGDTELASGNTE